MAKQETYLRFSLAQRAEHLLLIASFTTLAITGLVQKFAGVPLAEWLIKVLGGIESVRTVHHIAAIVFALEGVYHFIVVAYKVYVRRVEMSMLPGLKDITDAIDVLRYNLGLTKERPQLPRYNFEEKAEYWAMIWGAIVMGLTGFILWNPITTARLLPGEVIPAAKAAHGGEAVLAVLAILVWHMYNVHLKHFNKSIFTGKLTHHEMAEEHGEELVRLKSGLVRPAPGAEGVRRRERIFLPVALALGVLLAGGIYWFATFEHTAIATVPTPQVPVFVPLTPTPVPTPSGGVDNTRIGKPIPHPIAGQEQCDTCHALNGIKPYPADHTGRPNESCTVCHRPGPRPTVVPTEGAATPGATARPAGVAGAIPHALEGKEQCDLCHAAGGLKPSPADHAGRTNESCTLCHQPAGATQAAGATPAAMAPAIKHSIAEEIYKDCTKCHGPDAIKPAPANHAAYAVETCTACHQPAAQ